MNRRKGHSRRRGLAIVLLFLMSWIALFQSQALVRPFSLSTFTFVGHVPNKIPDDLKATLKMLSSPTRNRDSRNHSTKYNVRNTNATHAASWVLDDSSSWYGWQPEIHIEPDCKWRKCFKDNHRCRTTCRDEPETMGKTPRAEDIPHNWVPDVTILRRMFLAQKDADGNPWPPSLPEELCEPIGDFGNRRDRNLELLEAVPIVAEPLRGTGGGPKVLCMIYTVASAHAAQVRAIRETWAGGCDGFLAFSTESDPRIPAISIPHAGVESYDNMWQKVRSIWRFVHDHYVNDFDFFILGGDDLFVLPQNLRSYLATLGSPDSRIFAGRPLGEAQNIYNSGGAGYVFSRGTLKLFAKKGLNDYRCEPKRVTSMEDVMVAKCLRRVFGIGVADTRDSQGRQRFHPFPPGKQFHWAPGYPFDWFHQQTRFFEVKHGTECCAPGSVTFHYVKKPAIVRHLHALMYDSKCQNKKTGTQCNAFLHLLGVCSST